MAKLPYNFKTPVPNFFWESGFLNPEHPLYLNRLGFLTWAFAKCSPEPHSAFTVHKMVNYAPFEFSCGRFKAAKEAGLSEGSWETQRDSHLNNFYMEKTPNSSPNRFTCYRWTERVFSKTNTQPKTQWTPNRHPTDTHEQETKKQDSSLLKEEQEEENVVDPIVVPFLQKKIEEEAEALFAYSESRNFNITKDFFNKWIAATNFDYIKKTFDMLLTVKKFSSSPGAWFNKALTENYVGKGENKEINREFAIEFKIKNDYNALKINLTCATDRETGDDFQFNLSHEIFKLMLINKFNNKQGII